MDTESEPIRQRELLIEEVDNWLRRDLREKLDPMIDRALALRGYIEDRHGNGLIRLDSAHLLASRTFTKEYEAPFDGLSVKTQYDVSETTETLIEGELYLRRTGGYNPSRFKAHGGKYETKTYKAKTDHTQVPFKTLRQQEAEEIMQDIRAHTSLGYSASHTLVPVEEVIGELEKLHPNINVDQRAGFSPLSNISDPAYGDVQINIGKTYETKDVKRGRRVVKKLSNTARFLEVISEQPLDGGKLITGIHFSSGQQDPHMKITTIIDSEEYSEEQKQDFYDKQVRQYQEDEVTKFGHTALSRLEMINDVSSDIIRVL